MAIKINIWDKISTIGLNTADSFDEKIKIKNLNQSCAYSQFGFIMAAIFNYKFGYYLLSEFCLFSALILFSIYILNQKGHIKLSLYFFIFLLSISVFILNNYLGSGSGIYLYFFTIIQSVAFLFYLPNERNELALSVGFNSLLIGITFMVPEFHLIDNDLPIKDFDTYFHFNVIANLISSIYLVFITQENKKSWSYNLKSSLNTEQNTNKVLQKLVKDKDILLAELHHRVKNNLALINGLLTLQSRDTTSEEALMMISESKNRIRSMAILHDKLYLKNSYDDVNLAEYIKEIVDHINVSLIEANNIEIYMKFDNVTVDISKGISIGLIVNEIITNSLKHAFNNKDVMGTIEVVLKKGLKNHLKIVDNGQGLDEMIKRKNATSMGINIIGSLVDQIDGTYSITTDKGTYFDLYF